MELATVTTAGGTRAAVRLDDRWHALPASDLSELLASGADRVPGAELTDAVPTLPLPHPGKVICCVNGVERQRGNTKTLVFDCATLLAYISTFTVLRPGDVVLTGTPGGVG